MTGILHRHAVPVHRLALAALVLLACGVSWLVSTQLFPNFSANHDEPVYVFQARMLLDGQVTLPVTPLSKFFRPWMSGVIDDELVMVFPPVLPALLALGELFTGSMRGTLVVLAGITPLLTYALARELTSNRWTGVTAAALMAICPMFVIHSGMFLSYLLAMNLEMAAAFLLLRGLRRKNLAWFGAAGATLGLLFFARPFDAFLAGTPLLLATAFALRGQVRALAARLGVLAVAGLPFLAASLAYNHRLSGSWFKLPLEAIGGDDRPGFGMRHLAAGSPEVSYHFTRAVEATVVNVASLALWVPGSVLLFALAAYGLFRYRSRVEAWAIAAFLPLFPLGYLFYWGNLLIVRGRKSIGPHYYLGVLIPLVIFGAAGLVALTRRSRVVGVVASVLVVASAAALLVPPVRLNQEYVALHNREAALVEDAQLSEAVVFVPSEPPDGAWLMHPRPSFMNDPELDGSVLFAVDHKGDNFQLVDRYPERTFYRQIPRHRPGDALGQPTPTLKQLDPRAAKRFEVRVKLTNPNDVPVVTAYATDGQRSRRFVLDRSSRKGATYEAIWEVTVNGVEPRGFSEPPFVASLSGPLGAGQLAFGVTFSATTDPLSSPAVEERYWYRARHEDGEVDMMLPGEKWQYVLLPRRNLWVNSDAGPQFSVEVTELEPAMAPAEGGDRSGRPGNVRASGSSAVR